MQSNSSNKTKSALVTAGFVVIRALIVSGLLLGATTASAQWQKADFRITSLTMAPQQPQGGAQIAVTVTIANQGDLGGDAGVLRVWAAKAGNAQVGEPGDAEVAAGYLAVGESRVLELSVTAPQAGGWYQLRAFVNADNTTPEYSIGDNQSTVGYSVQAPAPWEKPDFVVASLAMNPQSPSPNGQIAATVVVKNQGDVSGDAGILRVWASRPANAQPGEPGDAEVAAGVLEVGETRELVLHVAAPESGSWHQLRAYVNADNTTPEKSTGNNQSTLGYSLTGGATWEKPDFTVTAIQIVPASPAPAEPFTAKVTVKNQGHLAGDAGLLRLWVSKAANAQPGEPGDADQAVGTLAVDESKVLTFDLCASPIKGTHHARAFVDADNTTPEMSEGNNQMSVVYTLHHSASTATVQVAELAQVYDGTPREISVTTDPAGLNVAVTYNGETEAPTGAGSYVVTAKVQQAEWVGSAVAELVVARAEQAIDFPVPGDASMNDTVELEATATSELPVEFAVVEGPAVLDGHTLTFTGAGEVTVKASQPGDNNWLAAEEVAHSFMVAGAGASISLENLQQLYDGTPRKVGVITDPEDLPLRITYNGEEDAPVNVGEYAVHAMVMDPICSGEAEGLLIVKKARQEIVFPEIPTQVATGTVVLVAGATSGLPVEFSLVSGPAKLNDNILTFTGEGTVTVMASQPGDDNWEPAEDVNQSFKVIKALASIRLENLDQTYNGRPRKVRVITEPDSLQVELLYDNDPTPPINVGEYMVSALIQDPIWTGKIAGRLVVLPGKQTIDFPSIPDQTTSSMVLLKAQASSGLPVEFMVVEGSAKLEGNLLYFTDVGLVSVKASQPGDGNWAPAEDVTHKFEVIDDQAVVILSNLEQVYDGTPRAVRVETKPPDLKVRVTYQGDPQPPIDVGAYKVRAVVEDPFWTGEAYGTLSIKPGEQTIDFPPVPDQVATATVELMAKATSGLPVNYKLLSGPALLRDNILTFTGAGTVTVSAGQPGDHNWQPAPEVLNRFEVTKDKAVVTLFNLRQLYDGTPRSVKVLTEPHGLAVKVTYNDDPIPPVNAGKYWVVATIADPIWEGQAEDIFFIDPAKQTIDFPMILHQLASATVELKATASSGLPVEFAVDSGPGQLDGNLLSFTGAGLVTIKAMQPGDNNWLPAEPVGQTIKVMLDQATVTLSNLEQVYDGSPRVAGVTTDPAGLAVEVTYDGVPDAPFNAGTYHVVATVADARYEGSASAYMTVHKAQVAIVLDDLEQVYNGEPRAVSVMVDPDGLPLEVLYWQLTLVFGKAPPSEEPPIDAGVYLVSATVEDENYEGHVDDELTVLAASQTIDFADIDDCWTTDVVELEATASSGLPVSYAVLSGPAQFIPGTTRLEFPDGPGVVVVEASQEGNDNWNSAEPVARSFEVKASNHEQEGPYTYSAEDGTATVVGFDETYQGTLVLPGSLGGLPLVGIDAGAFANCSGLTSVFIPGNIAGVGEGAFTGCSSLERIYFLGDAPAGAPASLGASQAAVYYLPGSEGWDDTFGGCPAVLWNPEFVDGACHPLAAACHVVGAPNLPIGIQSTTDLVSGEWTWEIALTNLTAEGTFCFEKDAADMEEERYYRIMAP